jgi:hypothetical protein
MRFKTITPKARERTELCCLNHNLRWVALAHCADIFRFSSQADGNDLRSLAAELAERTTRHELHQSINNQVKPLVTAMSSLEAALAIQESSNRQQQTIIHERAAAVERMYQEQQEYRLTHAVNASGAAPASVDRVYAIVEDVIRDRRLGEVRNGFVSDCVISYGRKRKPSVDGLDFVFVLL